MTKKIITIGLALLLTASLAMAWDYTKPTAGSSATTPEQLDTKIVHVGADLYDNAAQAPASSTDNAIARYDGTDGALQDSGIYISDTDVISSVDSIFIGLGSTTSNAYKLWAFDSISATTGTNYCLLAQIDANPSAASSAIMLPIVGLLEYQSNNDNTNHGVGVLGWCRLLDNGGTATCNELIGVEGKVEIAEDQTCTYAIGVESQLSELEGAATTWIGFHVADMSGLTNQPTNCYSFKSDDDNAILYNSAAILGKIQVNHHSASATLTAEECYNGIVTNLGATADITLTLPAAKKGMRVQAVALEAHAITLDPNGTDQILGWTDSAGDAIKSDGTAGVYIELTSVADGYWAVTNFHETWSDVN